MQWIYSRLDKYNCQMYKGKKISLFLLGKHNEISWSSKLILKNLFTIPIFNLELKVFLFRTKYQWPQYVHSLERTLKSEAVWISF